MSRNMQEMHLCLVYIFVCIVTLSRVYLSHSLPYRLLSDLLFLSLFCFRLAYIEFSNPCKKHQ